MTQNTYGLDLETAPDMFEELRALDAAVGRYFGFTVIYRGTAEQISIEAHLIDLRDAPRTPIVVHDNWETWKNRDDANPNAWIDEADKGLPYYSYTMNGAYRIWYHILTKWPHRTKMRFFDELELEGGAATGTAIAYPDYFSSLASTLPQSICRAFLKAARNLEGDLNAINRRTREIPRERGSQGFRASGETCAPWVHPGIREVQAYRARDNYSAHGNCQAGQARHAEQNILEKHQTARAEIPREAEAGSGLILTILEFFGKLWRRRPCESESSAQPKG